MLRIPGQLGKDVCDRGVGLTRRDLLRVGGSAMLGLSLAEMLQLQSARANDNTSHDRRRPRLEQGQERDPGLPARRPEPPRPVGSQRRTCRTTSAACSSRSPPSRPACKFTELLPKLAQVTDKMTMIRSMSYTPVGLFNHTAAIYQMHTGYTTDKVSPSGQLEPPSPKDFPTFGSNIIRLKPPTRADAAVRDAAAAAAREQRGRQGRHRRLPGPGLRSVLPVSGRRRHGHGQDGPDQGRRPEAAARSVRGPARTPRPAARHDQQGHARDRQGRRQVRPQRILRQGPGPDHFGPGPRRVRSEAKKPTPCAIATAATRSAKAACWPAAWSKPARAWSKSIWPKVANSRQPLVGRARRPVGPHEEPIGPDARLRACRR